MFPYLDFGLEYDKVLIFIFTILFIKIELIIIFYNKKRLLLHLLFILKINLYSLLIIFDIIRDNMFFYLKRIYFNSNIYTDYEKPKEFSFVYDSCHSFI